MAEEIQRELNILMVGVPGLEAIAISDRDGVPLIKATRDMVPELTMKPAFLAATSSTSEQGGKLGIGKCNVVVCQYNKHQVVNFNKNPFVVTLVATKAANTGLLLAMEKSFDAVVQELNSVVDK